MKPALILIDLQNDYLETPRMEPAPAAIVAEAAELLKKFRAHGHPIIHIRTTVTRNPDNRMPHWKEQGKWLCVAGTPGHAFATGLEPLAGEPMIDKQFFSGFAGDALDAALRSAGSNHLLLAGIHLHACVRATALDAYARGMGVTIALSATGSDDPLHAAITRRYLAARGIRFTTGLQMPLEMTAPTPVKAEADPRETIARKTASLKKNWRERPPTTLLKRAAALRQMANLLESRQEDFATLICQDVRKPITMARGEVRRSAALLRATADLACEPLELPTSGSAHVRFVPVGLIAAITPWNNPLAIPIGKIAPAYLFDNAILWKPSEAAGRVARLFLEIFRAAGGTGVEIANGGAAEAMQAAADPHVDAITITGSEGAGMALQEIAARRRVPFQAELGGNNAAIVAEDADIAAAARLIAEGAFGFSGQRCTANRRVIVPRHMLEETVAALVAATRRLIWGDPLKEATQIGPVISANKVTGLLALRHRVEASGLRVIEPHADQADRDALLASGHFFAPILVIGPDPTHEIVQEESFGPILVVQPADNFDHALQLLNGVRQGLAAALFSTDPSLQDRFLREAQAGILKINQATADADAVSPFGGWKASGVGPPEHGASDREFFTRAQTVYRS